MGRTTNMVVAVSAAGTYSTLFCTGCSTAEPDLCYFHAFTVQIAVIMHYDAATLHLNVCCYAGEVLEEDSLEIQQAVSHIAEVALLGVGDANRMFPESLEEMYDSYGGEEMEFRVIL